MGTLKEAGLNESRKYRVTDEEYFDNIELVWRKLGRQPVYREMLKPLSKYSNAAYEKRFGTWRKALEKFIDNINKTDIPNTDKPIKSKTIISEPQSNNAQTHKTKRDINYRLRFLVLRRDNFKCIACGQNPATNPSIILHIDHIISWDKGGETIFENLQTLCSICNIGKSNLDFK